MGKRFTPLIGLAVVVALAMAAVFGAMSLTPSPAAAVGPAITGLTVTDVDVTARTVDLKWDFIADHAENGDYRATWTKPGPGGNPLTGEEVLSGAAEFTVTAGMAATATAAMMPVTAVLDPAANSRLPFTEGDEFTIYVQSRADPADPGAYTSVTATPAAAPTLPGYQTFDHDGDTGETNPTADAQLGGIIGKPGEVTLKWAFLTTDLTDTPPVVTGWEYQAMRGSVTDGWMPTGTVTTAVAGNLTVYTAVLTDQKGESTIYNIRPVNGQAKGVGVGVIPTAAAAVTPAPPTPPAKIYTDAEIAAEAEFSPSSNKPGANTRYDLKFITTEPVDTLTDDELVIELADFDVPATIRTSAVAISVTDPEHSTVKGEDENRDFIPEDIAVDGEKIFITLGDMLARDVAREDYDITMGSMIEVVIRQSAGISNPSEAKKYGPVISLDDAVDLDWEAENDDGDPLYLGLILAVPRIVSLDEEDGGLGTVVTATAKGFKDKTSLTVFVDKPSHQDDDKDPSTDAKDDDGVDGEDTKVRGTLDQGEDVLCVVDSIGSDDIGKCEFTVTHPTFSGGMNYINAVDGRNGYINRPVKVDDEKSPMDQAIDDLIDGNDTDEEVGKTYELAMFDLTASVVASPAGGSPGEIMLVQVVDFPPGDIAAVELGRQFYCGAPAPDGSEQTCGGNVSDGSGNFKITIPNWVKAGTQELRVTGQDGPDGEPVKATFNVVLTGPQILVTPGTVLANQRISLVGTGFSSDAEVSEDEGHSLISIGGEAIKWSRINDGDDVDVDSGGNWSASVDLPLLAATTGEGERALRVTDSDGRSGVVIVDIPAREVEITPDVGRVGTIAVVRGTGFPSKNDEGSSFNVEIEYDAGEDKTTTVSAVPDASGRFEVQLRIPTTASIPSSNTVKVSFEDDDEIPVVTTVAHDVPEGLVNLSEASGGPGSTVTVSGEGFKAFVPVSLVKVGTLDVTPAPKPATDGNGMMSFDITIPGLDVGIQTIEVHVGGTTASVGFVVTESGLHPGNITKVVPALEALGDNFVNIWHFNNDTKGWSFHDGMEGSDLTHLITGETYLLQIKSTVEVILNRDTRNLTCVGSNCWNQIVW